MKQSLSYFDRRQHQRRTKKSEPDQLLDKKLWCIANTNNRPIRHADGYILLFYNKKAAYNWLEDNGRESWRVMPTDVSIISH